MPALQPLGAVGRGGESIIYFQMLPISSTALDLSSRRLGRSGLEVTPLALGGAGLGGRTYGEVTETEAVETVHKALELGISYIDTAPKYGDSERRIGLALQGNRHRVALSTKVGAYPDGQHAYSAEATLGSIGKSLELLRTDYLELVLIHDPRHQDDMDWAMGKGGALEALENLKAQGVIRAIGLGVRNHDFHRQAILSGRFDVILSFLDCTLLSTTARPLFALAAQHDVGVINGSPLAMGLLSGVNPRAYFQEVLTWAGTAWAEVDIAQRLWHWTRAHGHDLATYALHFSLREAFIQTTLVGAKTTLELEHLFKATQALTSDEVWQELERLTKETL